MSVTPNSVITPQSVNNGTGNITNSTGAGTLGSDTNGVAIYTAGANGSRVTGLIFSTSDTAANDVFLYVYSGATVIPIGQINVPLSSGNIASTPCVDGLNSTARQDYRWTIPGSRISCWRRMLCSRWLSSLQ